MAQVAPLDASRVSDIAKQIRGAVTPFLGANMAKTEASELLAEAATAETGMREGIILTLANLSQTGQWSEREITAAASAAAQMSNNDKEKALATFIGETKRGMHPNVRAHAHTLSALRTTCWADETTQIALDKKCPKPLRKAFSRSYHMLLQMFGEVAEGKRMFASREDVMAFAADRDPDLDYKKVLARLTAIHDTLARFHRDWPVEDIGLCVTTLMQIDEAVLKASRKVSPTVVTLKPTPAPVPATVVAESVVIPATAESNFVDEYLAA
jgi:hypothetical protein